VSIIYPRKPTGEMLLKEPSTGQRRFFAIPDLQDEQLVLPTGVTSRFYAQTPGNLQTPSPPGNGNGNGNGNAAAPAFTGPATVAATAAEGVEQFRLLHTTFGVIHCDSCHNAHSELHAGFLRDKSPQLCLLCHDR
jgi:predicted CXXCH cytochrome family protein